MLFEFGQYKIDVDVERTLVFYESAPIISEACSCAGCRNYERAVEALPNEVRCFFEKLGVDMKKAREVYVYCKNADGTLFYGGFYHICGVVLAGESAFVPAPTSGYFWDAEKAFALTDSFAVSIREECFLLEDDFPIPALQIDISANIPWVLAEMNGY